MIYLKIKVTTNQKENSDGPSWKAKRLTDSFVIFLSDL